VPTETRIDIPFLPQTGVTQSILQALQLANEHYAQQRQLGLQQQQLGMQQQALPSEIAQREATAGQARAETAAIPERLTLTQKEIDANIALRDATLKLEQGYRLGMLGVAQGREQETARNNAAKLEQEAFRNAWEAKLATAKEQGILGNMRLRGEALAQVKDLTEQEIALRQQANNLRDKGLNQQADMITSRADDMVNHIGVVRSIAGSLGLAPATQIPPAAGKPSTQPKPQVSKPVTVVDPRGVTHSFPDQTSADAFKRAAGIK
jgi:hypothetical protein